MKIEKRDEQKKPEPNIQPQQKDEPILRVRSNLRAGLFDAPGC